jgi:quinol monooxygenase YgiN
MTFAMTIILHVKPEAADRVLALLTASVESSRSEDGCLAFDVNRSPSDPNTIWLYEAYVSEQYHDEIHEKLPVTQQALAAIPQLLVQPPVITRGTSLFGR